MNKTRLDSYVRLVAVGTLCVFVLYGLVLACFPLLPFWIDEWLLIDNLKFKSAAELWGHLAHTQQFPRVYLELIKVFSNAFDYSYTSLRLPSFLTHCLGLALLYRLSGRIFRHDALSRFLWVMVYVSFNTSIHYFVQLKQYTMEMALSLAGIWQLLELLRMENHRPSAGRQALLCLSFALAPFFSYTYPIAAAPVYALVAFRSMKQKHWRASQWLAPGIGIIAIGLSYALDTRHVMADPGMQDFWQGLLMKKFSAQQFLANTYALFCNLGAGDLFGNIFGVLGVAAFLYGSYRGIKAGLAPHMQTDVLIQYSCLLLWLVLGLFVAGKLPLGTWRLNAFAVPAIGLLIVRLLGALRGRKAWKPFSLGISILLFAALVGNVIATMAELTGAEHARKLAIYRASGRALQEARAQNLPVLVTSAIAFPFDDRWPGDWILKTHPAYKVWQPLPVYPLPDADSAAPLMQRLSLKVAVVLDGSSVKMIRQ